MRQLRKRKNNNNELTNKRKLSNKRKDRSSYVKKEKQMRGLKSRDRPKSSKE